MKCDTPLGPNVRRLIVERMAQLQVERGKAVGADSVMAGVLCSMTLESIREDAAAALSWVKGALLAIRSAQGGEVYQTDEQAAAALLAYTDASQKVRQ